MSIHRLNWSLRSTVRYSSQISPTIYDMGLEQLFWSAYYKKDVSLLVQDVSFEARKQMAVLAGEVDKLQNVPQVISEGVRNLNQTLCQDCKTKLSSKLSLPQKSNTTKGDPKRIKMLPMECQRPLKDLETLLIQKENLTKGEKDGEKYGTFEEWHQQEIASLNLQYKSATDELRKEHDNIKTEIISGARRREQELRDQHEKKVTELQNTIESYKVSIEAKMRANENLKADRARDKQNIQRLEQENIQYKSDTEALGIERDIVKKELSDTKKREDELRDQHERKVTELQRALDNYKLSIESKARAIKHLETDRTTNRQRIKNLEDDIKMFGERIIEVSQSQRKEKLTQTDQYHGQDTSTQTETQREVDKKSKSWFSFTSGSSKDAMQYEQERLRTELDRISQEKDQIQKKYVNLTLELSQLDQTNSEQRNQITHLEQKTAKLERENENLTSEIQSALDREKQTEAQIEEQNSETTNLKVDLRRYQAKIEEQNSELTNALSQMETLKNQTTNLKANLHTKAEECQRQREQLTDSRLEVQQLLNDLKEQDKDLKNLRVQLDEKQQPRKKTIVCGLHCNRGGLGKSLCDMVVTELTRGVQTRLDLNNINLTIQFSQTPSEVTNWLQIVLCLNMSRVGTNILDAVKGMKGERDVYVLVLHHTNKNNLPSLTPTNQRVSGSELRQLGGILDLAFSSDSGLYACDINNNTFDKIVSVLRKFIIL